MEQEIKNLLLSECEEDFLLGVAIIKSGHVQFTRKDFDEIWRVYPVPEHYGETTTFYARTHYMEKLAKALGWIPVDEYGWPRSGMKEINYYKEENNESES